MTAADLVISSVLVPGARTPKLPTQSLFQNMRSGAAFVDVSIDQGGSAETSRPTAHHNPIYREEDVVHYCVTNMPAIVPQTSTCALTNVTLSYALELADKGLHDNPTLRRALNTMNGRVTHPGVAEAFALPCADVGELLAA